LLSSAAPQSSPHQAAPDHVESVRRPFIELLTREQIEVLGTVAEAVLTHLSQPPTEVS
jgi:hypothetical protein